MKLRLGFLLQVLPPAQPLKMAVDTSDASLITYQGPSQSPELGIEYEWEKDVHKSIKDLNKQGDFVCMAETLKRSMFFFRLKLQRDPIPCHHWEVDYYSIFLAILQYRFPEDIETIFTTLEYMSWALYGVIDRAVRRGYLSSKDREKLRSILYLAPNASMNGRSDVEAAQYWVQRCLPSEQELAALRSR